MLFAGSSRCCISAGPSAASVACFHTPTIPNETAEAVKGLEPPAVWSHFATLSSIPRPSGKEEAVLSYIKGYSDSMDLTWKQDAAGYYTWTCRHGGDAHNFDTDPILLI